MIPCGLSSFLIYCSSILSSSSHLMTNFDEFRALCGETLTGKKPSSLVVSRRFLHCCFVSTSIKTRPHFIGLTLSSSAFAIPSIAFFKTNAFKPIDWQEQPAACLQSGSGPKGVYTSGGFMGHVGAPATHTSKPQDTRPQGLQVAAHSKRAGWAKVRRCRV